MNGRSLINIHKSTLTGSEIGSIEHGIFIANFSKKRDYKVDDEFDEERVPKKHCEETKYTTSLPPPPPPPLLRSHLRAKKKLFFDDEIIKIDDDIIIIDDVNELCFEGEDSADDFKIGETNVSQLFRHYQNESIKIAKTDARQIKLNPECKSKFRDAIKLATKESCGHAINWLFTALGNSQALRENMGFLILECIRLLPMIKLKNEPSEITFITNYLDHIMKQGKEATRKKQTAGLYSIHHSSARNEWCYIVGEVSPPAEKNNVYKNCNDLIRVGIFMKDCLDLAIDLSADIKMLGFQCVDHKIDFYIMDLVQGTYIMIYVGQVSVPASVKEMFPFIDEMEMLLEIRRIFRESFDTLYAKLRYPSPPSTKARFKRDTLGTPKFKELVSKTRDCHRNCPSWYGRSNR
ncbi:hypothetical protein G9A89_022571 [Geosiphon pyriformis]|nr:hypothetical protein G9A89_022571 [Geosiphon pyriformis]